MFHKKSKGIIAAALALLLVMLLTFVLTIVMIWSFRYHVEIYIVSNALNSKSSLIPLSLFSSSYENGNYITELNRYLIDKNYVEFENENKEIIENYLTDYCFEIEHPFLINDFDDKYNWRNKIKGVTAPGVGMSLYGIVTECKTDKTLYRVVYPVPKIFDGKDWIVNYKFSVYEYEEKSKEENIE